jgi:hypothetical protein
MNPELRIGDMERDAAVAALGEHFAAGRLNKDEYDERSGAAWVARTAADLIPLFVDLPAPHPQAPTASRPAASSTTGSNAPFAQRAWWTAIGTIPVLLLLVVLALTTRLPWFFIAIFAWFWCARSARVRWHRSRHATWHDHRTTR